MAVSRFVLVDFRTTSDVVGHVRLYEAGNTYDLPRALAHAAAKRDLVAVPRPVDWDPPSILRPPEVLTEAELAAAEAELKALQRHAFGSSSRKADRANTNSGRSGKGRSTNIFGVRTLETRAILKIWMHRPLPVPHF